MPKLYNPATLYEVTVVRFHVSTNGRQKTMTNLYGDDVQPFVRSQLSVRVPGLPNCVIEKPREIH